jgi:hypothetical protein
MFNTKARYIKLHAQEGHTLSRTDKNLYWGAIKFSSEMGCSLDYHKTEQITHHSLFATSVPRNTVRRTPKRPQIWKHESHSRPRLRSTTSVQVDTEAIRNPMPHLHHYFTKSCLPVANSQPLQSSHDLPTAISSSLTLASHCRKFGRHGAPLFPPLEFIKVSMVSIHQTNLYD